MAVRGDWLDEQGFETAQSGTLYWTLSLYIDADRVARAVGQPGHPVTHEQFGAVQRAHTPSVLLRNAIDPLFNDIADREVQGTVQEHLLAAIDLPERKYADTDAGRRAQRSAAGKAIRRHERLIFQLPPAVEWSTEGLTYCASPPGLDDDRAVRFRRFWLAHNNGALSYHMSFSHHYGSLDTPGDAAGYDPATFYFLSLLQKLAAPKEFELDAAHGDGASVFDEQRLGIAPLDAVEIKVGRRKAERFWPFVKKKMLADGQSLFGRIAEVTKTIPLADLSQVLIDEVPFIEVPGLTVPKSRFMFLLHDKRFFDRLMPLDPLTDETAARKVMVQEPCYEPYQEELAKRIEEAPKKKGIVKLDGKFWTWVKTRPDYQKWIDGPHPNLRSKDGKTFENLGALAAAILAKDAVWVDYKPDGAEEESVTPLDIPAFQINRPDCLDYLFLAGFNQNIIDFMNQDTSEILDSIDPIYPDSSEQSDERFFVRYANHRAMITYVPKSRSLETGNDYIGTCPYAFLIHVMSLHNEFLAREHEAKSMARIDRIEWLVAKGQQHDPHDRSDDADAQSDTDYFDQAEKAINEVKMAEYREYERFRYSNPFRYDTERDVFTKLENLRGTVRKKDALALAIASLEDHASDLERRQQQVADKAAARRDVQLSSLLGGLGIFGAGQMIYAIGQPKEVITLGFLGFPDASIRGETIAYWTEVAMIYALILFVPFLLYVLGGALWSWLKTRPVQRRIAALRARLRGRQSPS